MLFLLTLVTTTFVGGHVLSLVRQRLRPHGRHRFSPSIFLHGLWYSVPVLLILGAHEMGHYLLCRRYNVDASLPYFIPLPVLPTGTLGAVIRIREMFPTRTILFDIGVAGPIAGFVVLLPALFWGMALSQVVPAPRIVNGLAFGEPLLFRAVSWLMFGAITGRPGAQRASDGVRGLVRHARHRAEPAAVRPVGRRPHHPRHAPAAVDDHLHRDGRSARW